MTRFRITWLRIVPAVLAAWMIGVKAAPSSASAEAIELVANGTSRYSVYIAPNAPESVRLAAEDLIEYLEKATGARLPLVSAESVPDDPFISLGDTPAARTAGFESGDVPLDGFRIVTRGENLFIFGQDEHRDPRRNDLNNISKGTLNGVYTFLEDYLNIRWLMPGELGEDVPRRTTLTLPEIDRLDQPAMLYRIIQGVHELDHPAVNAWKRRNKHGFARKINHGHNWHRVVPPELFNEHPEWFAEYSGKRIEPSGHYKLETTNPELVRYYADQVIEAFREDPTLYSFSLSPTDSGGWSQSPASRALDDVTPTGHFSASKRVITFYNDVARRVKQAYPDRLVVGYIYDQYFFPPSDGVPELEPNLFLMIAPLQNYGFRLFRPDVRASFEYAFDAWTSATDNWGYYDLPVTFSPNGVSLSTPPCLQILDYLYDRIHRHKSRAIYISGNPAFGYGGVLNYILAKLNWDPSQDPYELANEFYTRAYGPKAGLVMGKLYDWLESIFDEYYRTHRDASYHIRDPIVEDLYAPNYPKLEAMYLEAKALATNPRHIARLEQFEKNLAVLQWLLRSRGLIVVDPQSPIYRDDEQIDALVASSATDPALAPMKRSAAMVRMKEPAVRVRLVQPPGDAQPEKPFLLRGPSRWLLYPQNGQEAQILCLRMPIEEIVSYRIYDEQGRTVSEGILTEGRTVTLRGSGDQVYFMDVIASRAAYSIDIENCGHALKVDGRFRHKLWLHAVDGEFPTLYLHVTDERSLFDLALSSLSTNETVAADLISPEGRTVASFDTSDAPLQKRVLKNPQQAAGPWSLVFKQPRQGHSRYAFFQTGDAMSLWVGVDPDNLIQVINVAEDANP